jgi:hypothetical protein
MVVGLISFIFYVIEISDSELPEGYKHVFEEIHITVIHIIGLYCNCTDSF